MWLRGLQRRQGAADYHATEQQRGAGKHQAGASMQEPLLPAQLGLPRKTLVLDLDRTLIDCILAREPATSQPDFVYTDEQGCSAKVWMRPFLKQFLSSVARDFEVVLFTAAGPRHADCVLRVLDPNHSIFSHRLYGHHTKECAAWGWVKDLSRLGRPINSMLLVDDSLLAGLSQPCNLVPIRPFVHNDPKKDFDTALPELLRFLQDKVLPAPDVRQVIGLHWNKITRRPRKRPLRLHDSSRPPCGCTCHEQLHRMISSNAPVPQSLLTTQQQRSAAIPIRATLVPASTQGARHPVQDAAAAACVLVEQPSKEAQALMHHKCPAAGAGCGCMCSGADTQHVLAAVALWHRLSLEHGVSQQGQDDEDEVCDCCEQGLPLLHTSSTTDRQCLRKLSQVEEPSSTQPDKSAQPDEQAIQGTSSSIPGEAKQPVKAGMHRSRTDWQLSAKLESSRSVQTDGGGSSVQAAMDAAIAAGSAGIGAAPTAPLTTFSSAPCGASTLVANPRSVGACAGSRNNIAQVAQSTLKQAPTHLSDAVSAEKLTDGVSTSTSCPAEVPDVSGKAAPAPADEPLHAKPETTTSALPQVAAACIVALQSCREVPAQVPGQPQHTPFSEAGSWQDQQVVEVVAANTASVVEWQASQYVSPLPIPPPAQEALAAPGFWYTGGQYTGVCFSASSMQWERVGIEMLEVRPVSTAVKVAWERVGEADTNSSISSSSATTCSGSSILSVESCDLDGGTKPTTPCYSKVSAPSQGNSGSNGKLMPHQMTGECPAAEHTAIVGMLCEVGKHGGKAVMPPEPTVRAGQLRLC